MNHLNIRLSSNVFIHEGRSFNKGGNLQNKLFSDWGTIKYESKKTKYWIQIVINPKKGGWKELKEQINNGIFFNNKGERNGSTRTSR